MSRSGTTGEPMCRPTTCGGHFRKLPQRSQCVVVIQDGDISWRCKRGNLRNSLKPGTRVVVSHLVGSSVRVSVCRVLSNFCPFFPPMCRVVPSHNPNNPTPAPFEADLARVGFFFAQLKHQLLKREEHQPVWPGAPAPSVPAHPLASYPFCFPFACRARSCSITSGLITSRISPLGRMRMTMGEPCWLCWLNW